MRRLALAALLLVGCESSDPQTNDVPANDAGADTVVADTGAVGDSGGDGAPTTCAPDDLFPEPPASTCAPRVDDYAPGSATDGYAACISDDGTYHQVEASVSSLARVDALEQIAKVLAFGTNKAPSAADFLEARRIFSVDEGIASRVARREDEHYPPAAKACRDMNADELASNADRCAGPAKLLPILTKAFTDGANGLEPTANAARIEAALLFHFYLSAFKESRTCKATARDCDSMWAKYTGGEPRASGKGLSRYFRARSVATHEATYNAVLGVRCWRDLDNPTGPATNTAMHDRATAQLDRGLLRGVALIVRQRALRRTCGAAWEGARILGGFLDREATARDPARATTLRAELAKPNAAEVDEAKLVGALDALFPCP